MPRRSYILAGILLITALAVAVQFYLSDQRTIDTRTNANALIEAAEKESAALNAVATAEVFAVREDVEAAEQRSREELFLSLLPQETVCTTTPRVEAEIDEDSGAITKQAVPEKETCEKVPPTAQDLDRARQVWATVTAQIAPPDRLLPATGGQAWQLLVPDTVGGTSRGKWAPTSEPGTAAFVGWDATNSTIAWLSLPGWDDTGSAGGHLPPLVSQAEAEAGTESAARIWSPIRVKDAIDELERFTPAFEGKLIGIEDGATADQTPAEIKAAYEGEPDTNAFTDADLAKLNRIADGAHALPEFLQADVEVLHSRAGNLYWEEINEVPDTPGSATAIGHFLAVNGENDRDYRWEQLSVSTAEIDDNAVTEAKLDAAVRTKLNDTSSETGTIADNSIAPAKAQADTGEQKRDWRARLDSAHISAGTTLPELTDVNIDDVRVLTATIASGISFRDVLNQSVVLTAAEAGDVLMVFDIRNVKTWVRVGNILTGSPALRALITAAQSKADGNETAITAANLDRQTVIEIGPEFIHNETGPKTLGINIRHPLNAYSTATIMSVAVAGQPVVLVGYDNTLLHQDTLAEVSATSFSNIWAQMDAIDDGQGGTTNVQRWPVGSYIPVTVSLLTGRGGDTVFFRIVDVLVVDPPSVVIPQFTAKAATSLGSRIWTYTLASTDTEIWIGIHETEEGRGGDTGTYSDIIPRSILSSTARNIIIDHRNPAGAQGIPDSGAVGVAATISGNLLTLNSSGYWNDTAPIVLSK